MSQERYIRQTTLKGFGNQGQERLAKSKVLIVGLGGLGLPVAEYLNAMGVGTLGLVEQDVVELHNLQRQVCYHEADLGRPKLEVTLQKLRAQNSTPELIPYDTFLVKENTLKIIQDFDMVVDATDNFATRYLINDACVILKKPFVYGALHGFEGQISVFNYQDGPTYRCLFPTPPSNSEIPNCNDNGVLGVIPGIVGTLQALEAVKVVTGIGEVLSGELLLFDGLTAVSKKIKFPVNPENKKRTTLEESYDFSGCSNLVSISSEEFIALKAKKALQIIDVRTEEEFNTNHLDGVKNLPLSTLGKSVQEIDFNNPVYLICQSGMRSQKAFELLQNVYPKAELLNVSGGLNKIYAHVNAS